MSPQELFPPGHPDLPDIIFFFRCKQVPRGDTHTEPPHCPPDPPISSGRSNDMTQPCSSGRATTIRLRCDPLRLGTGTLAVPRWGGDTGDPKAGFG